MVTAKERKKIWQEGYKTGFMLFAKTIEDSFGIKDPYEWDGTDKNMRDIQYDDRRKASGKT